MAITTSCNQVLKGQSMGPGVPEQYWELASQYRDELIRQAAKVLRQTFRESDIIARLGGDEFVVLAAFDPSRTGEMVARLRAKLDTLNMDRPNEPALAMSVGVSSFQPGNTLEEVLADADRKMYADKAQRRARAQEGKPASDRSGSR